MVLDEIPQTEHEYESQERNSVLIGTQKEWTDFKSFSE
jgi:hypothetical protein